MSSQSNYFNYTSRTKFRIADNLPRPRSKWMAKSSMRYWLSWIVASTARNFSILWNGSAMKGQWSMAPGSPPRTSSMLRNMFGISTDVIHTNPALLNGPMYAPYFFHSFTYVPCFYFRYNIPYKSKKQKKKKKTKKPSQEPGAPTRPLHFVQTF